MSFGCSKRQVSLKVVYPEPVSYNTPNKNIYFKMYRMPALCLVSCKVFMIRW